MAKTEMARTGNSPPLDPNRVRIPDYEATGRPHGHDGNPPEFTTRKEMPWVDGRKEPTDSPVNINYSRVSWLHAHGRIEPRMFDAAERLAKDWELSQIQPRASSVLVGASGGGPGELPNDTKVAAMWRHGNAVDALGRLWPIVDLVVIENISVGKASASLRIHGQAAIELLRVGLSTLADHYKLPHDKK